MIAMVLSNKNTHKLEDKDIKFILNNYENYTTLELGEMFNVDDGAISYHLNKNNIKKDRIIKNNEGKGVDRVKLYEFIKKYSGLVNYKELGQLIEKEIGLKLSRGGALYHANKVGFKSFYREKSKDEKKMIRLFLDGDKENFNIDNLIFVPREIYGCMKRDYKKNKYTGESLLAFIKATDLMRSSNKRIKELEILK